jgi:dTDP-4-dehydrorhamnose reductase
MIDEKKILFTGGSGLLGKEVKKLLHKADYPTKDSFDITNNVQMNKYLQIKEIDCIVHAAAFTSPPKINQDPLKAVLTNIIGTANIVSICMEKKIRLIYISTDYVFHGDAGNYREEDPILPVNKYAWSKLGGECAVQLYDQSLIIRTSFGENQFPYPKAFKDQWTSRLPVSQFASYLVKIIFTDATGILHVGGDRKSVYEYAKSISPEKEIGELSVNEVSFNVPIDTSLDISKFKSLIEKL